MDRIILNELIFHAYHGVHDFEAEKGNTFRVDLSIGTDLSRAEVSDELEDTVDYEKVYGVVRSCMETRSRLLENVAHRIMKAIFSEWEQVAHLRVRISKMNPPIKGEVTSTAVELERSRDDYSSGD